MSYNPLDFVKDVDFEHVEIAGNKYPVWEMLEVMILDAPAAEVTKNAVAECLRSLHNVLESAIDAADIIEDARSMQHRDKLLGKELITSSFTREQVQEYVTEAEDAESYQYWLSVPTVEALHEDIERYFTYKLKFVDPKGD